MNEDRKVHTLRDGRRICCSIYGDSWGIPVFAFHGSPNSRLIWAGMNVPNVVLIAVDRPGYGGTDFIEGKSLMEQFAVDVGELADYLGINNFFILGGSGGGPYALALAAKLPERIIRAGIFAGMGPYNRETREGMKMFVRLTFALAGRFSPIFYTVAKMARLLALYFPKIYVWIALNEFGPIDRKIFKKLDLSRSLVKVRKEAFKSGVKGIIYDASIPYNWTVSIDKIKTEVYIWHGEEDRTIPVSMGRYLKAHIQKANAMYIENAGHLWIFENYLEIINTLIYGVGN